MACTSSALPLGVALVVAAGSARARIAVTVYAVSLVALFGVSALYHRVNWRSPSAWRWMRRLDHSMIFMLIAGTYTPLALLALHGPLGTATLVVVWAGALAGVLFKLVWIDAPTWRFAVAYIALGCVAVAAFPQLAVAIGVGGLTLFGRSRRWRMPCLERASRRRRPSAACWRADTRSGRWDARWPRRFRRFRRRPASLVRHALRRLTGATILLLRTVAQGLHGQRTRAEELGLRDQF